jgi:GDP-L-fucose synthase
MIADTFSPSEVFVAGATTALGQALVRRLQREPGVRLVGIDDGPDLSEASSVDQFFGDTRPEAVIVAAGRTAGIEGNRRAPADLMLDNLRVATHVIPAAFRHGTVKLLYLGSSCVYPRLAAQPLAVSSLWTGPVEPTSGPYAVAKLAGLTLCEAYRRQHGARFITGVKADAFGPGDEVDPANSHVVAGLLRRLHEAKASGAATVEIWGTGSPRREFIFIDDLADACVFLMRTYEGDAPINIGTGVSTSIRELAELLREIVGFQGRLTFDVTRPDGAPLKGLDSSALKQMGWAPAWELKTALAKTYAWFCEEYEDVYR